MKTIPENTSMPAIPLRVPGPIARSKATKKRTGKNNIPGLKKNEMQRSHAGFVFIDAQTSHRFAEGNRQAKISLLNSLVAAIPHHLSSPDSFTHDINPSAVARHKDI